MIGEVLGDHCPEVWVWDLFSAQKKHPAADWQVCLAHQLRDCQYAIEADDKIFAHRRLLLWAIAARRRWDSLAASTQYQYRCRLNRQWEEVLALCSIQADGIRLQKRYRNLREHLFLFLEDTTTAPTNNASEQAL